MTQDARSHLDWVSTREVSDRTGYRHLTYLRRKLVELGVARTRLAPRSPWRWYWPDIERLFSFPVKQ